MGVEVIRLYDWDPRNVHESFLTGCHNNKIGVFVSVSNYFLQAGGGLPDMNKQIPALIQSFRRVTIIIPLFRALYFGMSSICLAKELVSRTALLLQSNNSNFPIIAKCQSSNRSVLLRKTTTRLVGMRGINFVKTDRMLHDFLL